MVEFEYSRKFGERKEGCGEDENPPMLHRSRKRPSEPVSGRASTRNSIVAGADFLSTSPLARLKVPTLHLLLKASDLNISIMV